MKNQLILVLDFGGQYRDLIARRVREHQVYSEIKPCSVTAAEVKSLQPIGIILTGGPSSVYDPQAPVLDPEILKLGIPILGICYGQQIMSKTLGGTISEAHVREYGKTEIHADTTCPLFEGLLENQSVLMSHTDQVTQLPEGFVSVAQSESCKNAAVMNPKAKLFGLQFHPEVDLTIHGKEIIRNFLFQICHADGDFTIDDIIQTQTENIKAQVGDKKVLLALSGGVDSSVVAALLGQILPNQLYCIFVDHGFMRKDEGDAIELAFKDRAVNFIRVNAQERFLEKLKGISDPEQKRKIIGKEFVAVFNDEAKKLDQIDFLAQGTIYPDIIESGGANAATIKSHHNVGGLPEDIGFSGIIEPLRLLFKDEVRSMGRKLGLPDELVNRQPFPGPGLAIRIIGEITAEKLHILREADAIFREEVDKLPVKPNQYFAALTNMRSVGVMGDGRTYDYALALRAVQTTDFMTASYVPLPYEVLDRASSRIINEIKGINRILYDVTSKPPATIEYE